MHCLPHQLFSGTKLKVLPLNHLRDLTEEHSVLIASGTILAFVDTCTSLDVDPRLWFQSMKGI